MIEKFIAICESKEHDSHASTFLFAIFAGVFIAFGASSSNLAVYGIENAGLAKVVAGVIFPVGLMLIVCVGGELFTGDCMLVLGNFDGKYPVSKTIQKLILVYLGNMLGSVIIAFLLYWAGQFDFAEGAVGAYTLKVAAGKTSLSFGRACASGILCNILVCAAVLMASRIKDYAGKIIAVFFPILAFVIGGFEHCVANMYYLSAGLIALQNPLYVSRANALYGISEETLSSIHMGNILLGNLLPVTIGNMIGGMLFISLPLYILEKQKQKRSED